MNEGYWLADSPLSQKITRDGMTVEVLIYRSANDEGWILEVIDQENGATVWDHSFPTDQAALDAVKEWKYTPPLLNGTPVDVIMTVTVNFNLQ